MMSLIVYFHSKLQRRCVFIMEIWKIQIRLKETISEHRQARSPPPEADAFPTLRSPADRGEPTGALRATRGY